MPRDTVASAFLKKTGPWVVAPSANFKNQAPATDAETAVKDLYGAVDIIIASGRAKVGISSTVIDMTKKELKILRQGSVKI